MKYLSSLLLIILIIGASGGYSQNLVTTEYGSGNTRIYTMENECISLKVVIKEGMLTSDTLTGLKEWTGKYGSQPVPVITDAGFSLDIDWAYWSFPGRPNNAENPVSVGNADFTLMKAGFTGKAKDKAELVLLLQGKQVPMQVMVTYLLESGRFWYKRKIAVCDSLAGTNYLNYLWARKGNLSFGDEKTVPEIIKKGEFGQPVAALSGKTGCFFGLEYPGSTNTLSEDQHRQFELSCYHESGTVIGKEWTESEWVVGAYVPVPYVREWFMKYVDDLRIVKAKPFVLYNSWYDLRSPSYPGIKPGNYMNEQNVMKIIDLFKNNMFDKYKVSFNAFVLDDGWDIYESDWQLNKESFPGGLKPVSDRLKTLGISLGIWYGPVGGYSFHDKRVNWMKNHGYELTPTGFEPDTKGGKYPMLCLTGKKYGELFKKRTTDMVANDGVGYFKWDGIQFECNEPDHGHPVGIFSRCAAIDGLIDKCNAVRAINPNVYLNITSGTWLSPWWLKYANQLWMQGEDYSFSNIPSITSRDAAITYRDYVLYDDFHNKDLWFPVSNLMTHGIIKGNIESVGGTYDPVDIFTNDVVLYFARGISMFELYISPDLLTGSEWNAIAKSILWAKDRQDILANTVMEGNNPADGSAYAYIHFKDKNGIIAARNPVMTPTTISIEAGEKYGLDPDAKNLVLERVYPDRWISPQLFAAGKKIDIQLAGYELAVYEIYPLSEAKEPLVAGINFSSTCSGKKDEITYYGDTKDFKILNPELVRKAEENGREINAGSVRPKPLLIERVVYNEKFTAGTAGSEQVANCNFEFSELTENREISVLVRPGKDFENKKLPGLVFMLDGRETVAREEKQDGLWAWYTISVPFGFHKLEILKKDKDNWKGTASVWSVCTQQMNSGRLILNTLEKIPERILPPLPFPPGTSKITRKIGEAEIR